MKASEVGLGTPAREVGLQIGKRWFVEAEGAPDVGVVAEDAAQAFEIEGAVVEG